MWEYKSVKEVLKHISWIGEDIKSIAKDMKKFDKNPKYKQTKLDNIRSFDE